MLPRDVPALLADGEAHRRAGRFPEAEALYRRVLDREPTNAEALHGLGVLVDRLGSRDLALRLVERAVRHAPSRADYLVTLGDLLQGGGAAHDALACYRRAVGVNPGHVEAHHRLGEALAARGELGAALSAYRAALLVAPEIAEGYRDLAAVQLALGRPEDAAAWCRRGLARAGDDPRTRVLLARALLQQGDYAAGFAEHEARLLLPEWRAIAPATEAPRWDGGRLDGRTVLLHAERDLEDTLLLARYARLVEDAGGRVVLACQPSLVSLLGRMDGVDSAVPVGSRLPPHSAWVPLPSLPRLLDTTLDSVPATVPYLRARPDRVARWAARLGGSSDLTVGLAWGPGEPELFAALGAVEGVRLVAMPTDIPDGAPAAPPGRPVAHLSPAFDDFEDLAAVVSQLDLVIAMDGAVAHLAGALGRPTWVLHAPGLTWRWLVGRDDTPWYPGMRLFRQHAVGEWHTTFARVEAELAVYAAGWREG